MAHFKWHFDPFSIPSTKKNHKKTRLCWTPSDKTFWIRACLANSEVSDKTRRILRLIQIYCPLTIILLVLECHGLCHVHCKFNKWRFAGGPMMAQHRMLAWFSRGSGSVLLKNPYIFVIFQGGGGLRTPCLPSGSAQCTV